MATDLQITRSKSTINTSKIGDLLYDDGYRETRARIAAILEKEPLFEKTKRVFLDHSQLLHLSLRISKRLLELRDTHSWTEQEFHLACILQDDGLVISLHALAFTPVILSQGSDEQQAKWIPRCRSYEVVGCYAQTELSHGNNVQGLETTARYDPKTKEFIISSPRVESTKWWMGGLGILANHAAVIAHLELPSDSNPSKYKSYGPHLFIVPLRSSTTHEPLPGITVGLIGPKSYGGFGMADNGYVRFNEVRIPLENMLNRHSQVTPAGKYIPAKHNKLSYGSMVALRAQVPLNVAWALARAITIAIRYSIHRRQFSDGKSGRERQVISYASVQYRLYPLLAQAYASIISGRELSKRYREMNEAITQRGDVSMLAEIHSLSTAIKCKVTSECVHGIEEARKCLGGHGFSHMSGIGTLFANSVPSQTYEGDNYLIAQQTARALLKHAAKIRAQGTIESLPPSSLYLRSTLIPPQTFTMLRSTVIKKADWLDPTTQLAALEHRAAFLVMDLGLKVTSGGKDWSAYSWDCYRVTDAHADVFIVSSFQRAVAAIPASYSHDEKKAIALLYSIHTLSRLVSGLAELFESGFIDPMQSRLLRKALDEVVTEAMDIETAVAMTDAFSFTPYEMSSSVLGKDDGKVYEEMWRVVQKTGDGLEFREEALAIVQHHRGNDKSKPTAKL